jgi:hypothetical protein
LVAQGVNVNGSEQVICGVMSPLLTLFHWNLMNKNCGGDIFMDIVVNAIMKHLDTCSL